MFLRDLTTCQLGLYEKQHFSISRVCTIRPKLGVFSKLTKIHLFCCFITPLVNKLQLVLNTKRPLSNSQLLRCKQNSFECFRQEGGGRVVPGPTPIFWVWTQIQKQSFVSVSSRIENSYQCDCCDCWTNKVHCSLFLKDSCRL